MIKILVVDDDAYIRRLVSTILNDAGFDVYEAADGRDALLKLDDDKIDLWSDRGVTGDGSLTQDKGSDTR